MPEVDLRSDTVTRPTAEMREAMATAEVGNAAWGEDPTVNRLEQRCAELFGKEAAMLVPSGTMGNQAAVRVWTSRTVAPEVICHERSHVVLNEAAGVATVSGAQVRTLPGPGGVMDPAALAAAIQDPGIVLKPSTALLCLEDTHNYEGGTVLPLDHLREVAALASDHDLPVHLDGARVWNAAVALDATVEEVARHADTVQFCFSKGLACPVGSMLVGPQEVIQDARKVRQYLGGAMRQAGVLAACAEVALDTVLPRLHEDHERAARLARGLADLPIGFRDPETNILVLDTSETGHAAADLADALAKEGVLLSVIGPHELRAVTHLDVDDEGIERAVDALHAVLA